MHEHDQRACKRAAQRADDHGCGWSLAFAFASALDGGGGDGDGEASGELAALLLLERTRLSAGWRRA